MKAGAFKSVAHSFDVDKLAVSSHLYTSERLVADFPGRMFEILEAIPFSKSSLKEAIGKYPQANGSGAKLSSLCRRAMSQGPHQRRGRHLPLCHDSWLRKDVDLQQKG